ncbi:MAG: hydrogenase iron-sulfur subunit [Rhodospirillales bacterium]|nr:hydrogenase iron-sulfur subunit [Rhodospirillales bacterium]MDH3912990.1 hydrogenase iron-sulfur subunit [Rhodospirillales bacterium]MDH3920273.1 hydrogenase iron-sulfur subunit [Rhodospirillales bacterium]MDH3969386.1 hydrogenase iron-sulfur subunit [Rhodospirillales bacterium]
MTVAETPFEPKIVAFCCRHCAYAAADLAGTSRLAYPPSLNIVELPCTGRVDVLELLRTFEDGVDGLLVAGCLPGRCHYLAGNLHARQRVDYAQRWLEDIGLEGERLRMINLSAAMGAQFAELATEMAETIKSLGPSPLGTRRAAGEIPTTGCAACGDPAPLLAESAHDRGDGR